jgi:hypothetical protein
MVLVALAALERIVWATSRGSTLEEALGGGRTDAFWLQVQHRRHVRELG